jgi:secreted trypsin-like serine protease
MKNVVFTLGLSLSFFAEGIVIRHDVDDVKYLANQQDFPPLATFYVDGAHGTLIKPNWIITAAHATFCVKAGSFVSLAGKTRKVTNVYVNPDYTPGKSHDIALIELQEAVTDVAPASIYLKSDEQGKNIWFIGIGGTGNGLTGQTVDNAANKGILRKAQNTIIEAKGPLIKFKFDKGDNALPLEGVSGGGDSGGPAYIKNGSGFKVLGISSRPEGSFGNIGEYGITEVYSRVSYFSSWIDQLIEATPAARKAISLAKLKNLPAGVTEDILPMVCNDIGLNQ